MAEEIKFLEVEQEKLDFERERHARDQWWQEDRLINQRLTWLLTSHGVIGAGYAWVKHRISEITVDLAKPIYDFRLLEALQYYQKQLIELADLLKILGSAVSVLVLIGIASALWAQHKLQKVHYPQYRLYVTTRSTIGGHGTALLMPLLCLGAWMWIGDVSSSIS